MLGWASWSGLMLEHQSYRKVALRHTLKISHDSASYILPYQKNSRLGRGSEILLLREQTTQVNALALLTRYVSVRDERFRYHPQIWLTARSKTPTRAWFMRYLRASLSAISRYSMRAGGATALAATGVTPALIQAAGRWSSDEFQKYIRKHPLLLQLLILGSRMTSLTEN
ncbi:hypothetical protein CY34DRAFT_799212 [Suillus luteus UH-Slu-Lm8-n1]|uniref:Uncharacterized protein n=1 Tax=Suillus luteus UH-Slu-Lm8-n1 TaxID=930992 RepID=A0A0D0AB72_9AGAM|nr:hypothetical protein CY34DRAFT_799212 [Suillus luteus UH-Slu-Lm8-n1]